MSSKLIKWDLPKPPDRSQGQEWKIGILSEPDDYHCVLLASMGFNYRCISQQTGLSFGQISYRLRRAGVKPKDYRSGSSKAAQAVLQAAARRVAAVLNPQLRQAIDV